MNLAHGFTNNPNTDENKVQTRKETPMKNETLNFLFIMFDCNYVNYFI